MAGTAALCLLALVAAASGVPSKLPSYMTACSRSDPKLDECIVKNGKYAIPIVIKGDSKYRIPKLDPLLIPELQLRQGSDSVGLNLSWKNAELHGLRDADLQKSHLDVKKRHIKMEYFMPAITITGTYTASGRVLLLPLTGTGPSNITCQNMKISYDLDWDLVRRGKENKEYIQVTESKVTLHDIGFMSLKFHNLFNGDKVLASNMNRFLNENWKELSNEFGPGVADAIGEVFKLIVKSICDNVPYDLVITP